MQIMHDYVRRTCTQLGGSHTYDFYNILKVYFSWEI